MRTVHKLVAAVAVVMTITGFVVLRSTRDDESRPSTGTARSAITRFELNLAGIIPKKDSDAMNLALTRREQQLTSECMHSQRFNYTPVDPHVVVDTTTETDFTSVAYARQYGFGISAWPRFAPNTSGNAQYLASLSHDKQKKYTAALQRCSDDADNQANNEYGVIRANNNFSITDARVQKDPRYTHAVHNWSACAARKGYNFPSREALMNSLRDQYTPILRTIDAKTASTDTQREHSALADPTYLHFRQHEITTALDVFPCSRPLDTTYATVYQDLRKR